MSHSTKSVQTCPMQSVHFSQTLTDNKEEVSCRHTNDNRGELFLKAPAQSEDININIKTPFGDTDRT